MSRMHHELKTDTKYYQDVEKGIKTFELRWNDRDFKVGDMVVLKEVAGQYAELTGRSLPQKEIIYILEGGQFGLRDGFVILQLK